jgi:hypothetical protein
LSVHLSFTETDRKLTTLFSFWHLPVAANADRGHNKTLQDNLTAHAEDDLSGCANVSSAMKSEPGAQGDPDDRSSDDRWNVRNWNGQPRHRRMYRYALRLRTKAASHIHSATN